MSLSPNVAARAPKSLALLAALVLGVGSLTALAAPVRMEFELRQGAADEKDREKLLTLTDGATVEVSSLPPSINAWLSTQGGPYDELSFRSTASEGTDGGWSSALTDTREPASYSLTRRDGGFFPNVGVYTLTAQVFLKGAPVASNSLTFTLVDTAKPPRNTTYMKGRKDSQGTPITTSKPVVLGPLNETAKLKDNDYPFTPQQAFDVVNFERFPPFKMNPKFVTVWNTGRWNDESKFGGPLSRGFSHVTGVTPEDNLYIKQRAHFGYPAGIENLCKEMSDKDPKYKDLMLWAERNFRCAWISPSNAFDLGWNYYNVISGNGAGDVAIFGWDEEEMWPGNGIKVFKEHPEWLPEDMKALHAKDPDMTDPATQQAIEDSHRAAMATFIGYGYQGSIAAAASRGRRLTIYHYGSLGLGLIGCTLYDPGPHIANPTQETPVTYENSMDLVDWYRVRHWVDFTNNVFTRTVQYFHKDSYFFYAGPQTISMYQRDKKGHYVLDANGRRKVREDVTNELVYARPTKVGFEDYGAGPANMKEFIAKQENSLYWMNGGKYYKQSGTLITEKRPLPTMRPHTQPTLCMAGGLGMQPVPPYLVEAAVINNFMIGVEGYFLWDEPVATGPLSGQTPYPDNPKDFGEVEFMIKGLHRLSQFNRLFDGQYSFIRPNRQHDIWDRDRPVIRGIINGRYLLLAMSNPFLDIGETQTVEVWYDKPYGQRKQAVWLDQVTLQHRRNHLFQCKLPAAPKGGYDPDKLFFRFTCVDGDYTKTYTVTGNYNVPYPHEAK